MNRRAFLRRMSAAALVLGLGLRWEARRNRVAWFEVGDHLNGNMVVTGVDYEKREITVDALPARLQANDYLFRASDV